MDFKVINNNEKGLAVRSKINEMLRNLITGSEGVNALWTKIKSLSSEISTTKNSVNELDSSTQELFRQSYDYVDQNISDTKSKITNDLNDLKVNLEKELTNVTNSSLVNKGYFDTIDDLKRVWPSASTGCIAYVGTSYPYQIWKWNGSNWVNSGQTGGDESIQIEGYLKYDDLGEV